MKTWFLPSVMALLASLGLLTLRSVAPSLVNSQLVFCLLGAGIFWAVSRSRFHSLVRLSWLGYLGTIILLIIPLLIGKTTRGIAGWIDIGSFFSIQPSQLAMPIIGLAFAEWLAHHQLSRWENLIKALALLALPAVLIVVEPDLGTTVVFLFSLGVMLFMSSVKWQQLALLGVAGAIMVAVSWVFVLETYQKQRITSFLGVGEESAVTAASYNARQSLIAVGSGQAFGRGLGQGVQSHLRFLPERQTDFIFASLSEELGFVGAFLVVGLYWSLIGWCFWLAWQTQSATGRLYALGCGSMFLIQCSVNIGMNMGLLPITGITLPFVSYGGSSLLSLAGMLGILQSLRRELPARTVLHLS